jgi:serine/threonine protein kinase
MKMVAAAGITHRDIKSQNILVFLPKSASETPAFKIADFNISKKSSDKTTMATVKGTPANMAPELFDPAYRGNLPYGQRTDVYAFGIVFNELMTEQIPFDGQDVMEIIPQVCFGVRPERYTPSKGGLDAVLGEGVRSLIDGCVDADASSRPTFAVIAAYLSAVSAETVKVSKNGATAKISLPLFEGAHAGKKTRLRDLTVAQLQSVFTAMDEPEVAIETLERNRINGMQLQLVDSVEELSELLAGEDGQSSIRLNKFQLKALHAHIMEFKASGIPTKLLSTPVSSASPSKRNLA